MQVTFILEFKLFVSEKYDFFKNKYAPILSPTQDRNMSTYSTTKELKKKVFLSTEAPILNTAKIVKNIPMPRLNN